MAKRSYVKTGDVVCFVRGTNHVKNKHGVLREVYGIVKALVDSTNGHPNRVWVQLIHTDSLAYFPDEKDCWIDKDRIRSIAFRAPSVRRAKL